MARWTSAVRTRGGPAGTRAGRGRARPRARPRCGEMDVGRRDEMPPGRQPVETRVLAAERLPEVADALGRHIAQGKQAYWVCPLGEESEASDLAAGEGGCR